MIHSMQFVLANAPFLLERRFFFVQKLVCSNIRHLTGHRKDPCHASSQKSVFVALGCISLALGTIDIALPILPTVPFYLLTAFCFANSSERLHTWFTHTTVYKKYIGSYFRRRGMTRKAKALLIGTVTAIMLPGFILMDKVPVGRAIMAIVWAGHIVYFGFKVQTITQQEADDAMAQALEE